MAWVVGADDTVEQRMLELDRAVGDDWLVRAGLAVGDRLIVEGRQRVRPGTRVRAVSTTGRADGTAPPGGGNG
jgi:membrane fusion protein (multidrug efflux system)